MESLSAILNITQEQVGEGIAVLLELVAALAKQVQDASRRVDVSKTFQSTAEASQLQEIYPFLISLLASE